MAQTILTVYAGDQVFKLVWPGLCSVSLLTLAKLRDPNWRHASGYDNGHTHMVYW